MSVRRLSHVNIRTPLLEETVRFYEQALGLKRGPVATMVDQVNNAWLYDAAGDALVHVNRPLPGEVERPANLLSRIDHVAFACTQPLDFAARLIRAGIPFDRVDLPLGGLLQFNLRDPNGIKVELTFEV